jgi:hypothetical protein
MKANETILLSLDLAQPGCRTRSTTFRTSSLLPEAELAPDFVTHPGNGSDKQDSDNDRFHYFLL